MTLYHFSEDPAIACFRPRPPLAHPEQEPRVWAVDAWHAPHYYFPRDCPRAAFWAVSTTTLEDRDRFLGHTAADRVIAIEGAWLERVRSAKVYAYQMPPEIFEDLGDAGYYVSRQTVTPLRVEPMGDLLARLVAAGVELRVTPSLWPLHRALVAATMNFSMIRMRNALPEAAPTEKDTP